MKIFTIILTFFMMKGIDTNSQNLVTITNAGYNGNNTVELLARVDKDVVSKKPQLVVLMVGTNDMLNQRNMLTVQEYKKELSKAHHHNKKNMLHLS